MSTCKNKSKQLLNSRNTVSQQILAAVTTRVVIDKSTDYAKPHSICFFFTTILKITKEILVKICWQSIENTNSDFKVHALHCANELLVRVRLSCQKLFQTRPTCRNLTFLCLGISIISWVIFTWQYSPRLRRIIVNYYIVYITAMINRVLTSFSDSKE